MAGLVPGVELEGQVVLLGELGGAGPAPVAEAEAGVVVDVFAVAAVELEGALGVVVGAGVPGEGAVVGVLGLDGDGEGAEAVEEGVHRLAEGVEVSDVDAGVVEHLVKAGPAAAEAGHAEVVEEEVGGVGVGGNDGSEGVGLDVVEVGAVAEQGEALSGLREMLLRGGGGFEGGGGKVVEVVEVSGDESDSLAVAGVLHERPSGLDGGPTLGDGAGVRVKQRGDLFAAGPGADEVGGDVVVEELLQHVGGVLRVPRLVPEVLVGVAEGRVGDVVVEVGGHKQQRRRQTRLPSDGGFGVGSGGAERVVYCKIGSGCRTVRHPAEEHDVINAKWIGSAVLAGGLAAGAASAGSVTVLFGDKDGGPAVGPESDFDRTFGLDSFSGEFDGRSYLLGVRVAGG